jgi:hypothetical protein
MMKRSVVSLFLVLLAVGTITAQIKPAIKMGVNLSNVYTDYDVTKVEDSSGSIYVSNDFGMKPGFQGGLFMDWPLSESFTLQPGLQFITQGFSHKYATSDKKYERRFTLFYLQVPVNVQYKLRFEYFDILFQAGPYFGYGLSARQSAYLLNGKSQDLNDDKKKIDMQNSKTNNGIYNKSDLGVGAALGVDFSNFQVMVGYNVGLNGITFSSSGNSGVGRSYNMDFRNNSMAITFGYVIGRRKDMPVE